MSVMPGAGDDGRAVRGEQRQHQTETNTEDTVFSEMAIQEPPPLSHHTLSPAGSAQTSAPTFVDELKTLSLEATAERHLGSTSGISFAKLTQAVLRRLTPDKADFVFVDYQEDTAGASLSSLDSPSEPFGESVLNSLSESISVHPLLFGDLFLADFTEPDTSISSLAWPSGEAHVQTLVDFYFAHSHTLYPILRKVDVLQTLEKIRGSAQRLDEQPPLEIFRLWMVLAIGSTARSSILLTEESESRVYYSKALQYSESALGSDEMSALEVIMLQVSYSFFNQLGPNTWFLVGTAARLALGMGLHTASTYAILPPDTAQRYKRVFFSIYMMDRVVSVVLGRPFAIHDDDVDVEPFDPIDEDCTQPDGRVPTNPLEPSPLVVPLHILGLRRIAGKISRQVYSNRRNETASDEDQERILSSLHQELLEWRQSMPFPLPAVHDGVPHLNTAWYDFNYYTHLAMLYRPSPLCPVLDLRRIKILEAATCMSIRQAYSMHQQRRLAYNWLNLLALFTSTVSLVYAITAQPDDLATVLRETRAVEDLDLALHLFETLGTKFPAATKIRNMIHEISERYKGIRSGQTRGSR
ncbi:hypothetical protein CMUS01_08274 [Colletotrichum musicola]|uniref:Xylanolytic transcriptional activator regulatory domain-containing protein n=1 Tax=Colletotrichum musicola TaxID=2175873 RepID=A0A8H6NE12_9PEZI|nr:hypothetical protein CMUS01_08274 [Colletotrichum musicola]